MDTEEIKRHVKRYYAELFARGRTVPTTLPILSGRELATELGYPSALFDLIPDQLWDLFAPCGNPLPHLSGPENQWLLNLGCGAGIDSFAMVAQHPGTHVVGLDVVWTVLHQAHRWADTGTLQSKGLFWVCGDAAALPFQSQHFDAAVLNGVFNLFPDKESLLGECRRVLKPRGQLLLADLCSHGPLPDHFAAEADAWAWCMSGALTLDELLALLNRAGFDDIMVNWQEHEDMLYRTLVTCRKAEPKQPATDQL